MRAAAAEVADDAGREPRGPSVLIRWAQGARGVGRGVATGVVALALAAGVAGWAAWATDAPGDQGVAAGGAGRRSVAPTTAVSRPVRTAASPAPTARTTPVVRPSPDRSPGRAGAATTVVDVRLDPTAPRRRAAELLTTLARSRAEAWRGADTGRLVDAEAPTGPLYARDAAGVTQLARAGLRYEGLQYEVSGVRTVRVRGDLAVVTARIATSAYEVVGEGPSVPRAATAGRPVVVELVRTDGGWRIRDLMAG